MTNKTRRSRKRPVSGLPGKRAKPSVPNVTILVRFWGSELRLIARWDEKAKFWHVKVMFRASGGKSHSSSERTGEMPGLVKQLLSELTEAGQTDLQNGWSALVGKLMHRVSQKNWRSSSPRKPLWY